MTMACTSCSPPDPSRIFGSYNSGMYFYLVPWTVFLLLDNFHVLESPLGPISIKDPWPYAHLSLNFLKASLSAPNASVAFLLGTRV